MTQKDNGRLGDWASKSAKARPIEIGTKTACLELFKKGVGYRKAAGTLGLRPYTVRDWLRSFRASDESWAARDGRKFARGAEARDLVEYRSRIRRRKHPDGYYKEVKEMLKANRAPNILGRDFASERPMAKLTTDVTYVPCSDRKFVYVSPLLDLFNHEVVSYSVGTVNSEALVARMLAALPPETLRDALVHNDQGSVYWSKGWVALCEKLRIVRSMSRRGNCWDNALSENFFSSMKADLGLTKGGYKVLLPSAEIKDLVNDYMPWYNTGRIQKRLHFLSPVDFREAYLDGILPTIGAVRPIINLRTGAPFTAMETVRSLDAPTHP